MQPKTDWVFQSSVIVAYFLKILFSYERCCEFFNLITCQCFPRVVFAKWYSHALKIPDHASHSAVKLPMLILKYTFFFQEQKHMGEGTGRSLLRFLFKMKYCFFSQCYHLKMKMKRPQRRKRHLPLQKQSPHPKKSHPNHHPRKMSKPPEVSRLA